MVNGGHTIFVRIDILIYEVNTVVYDKINVLIQRIDVIYIYTRDNYLVDKYI